jgi:hypothetical protein
VKPSHRKQYVNLKKDEQGSEDECGLKPLDENATRTCVLVEVDESMRGKLATVEILVQDPEYEPPDGDTEPTNPGVATDFGRLQPGSGGGDNRGTPGSLECPAGKTCWPCYTQPGSRFPCRKSGIHLTGQRWTAEMVLNTGAYGGDNFRVVAIPIRSSGHPELAMCANAEMQDPLAVWRKFGVYEDKMQAGDHNDDPDSSRVAAAFRDAFIQVDFLPWVYTEHADWLRHLACFEGPLEGETYPESAGAAYFVHEEISSRYPEGHGLNPPDTVQIFGAHILAKERSGEGESGYGDKAFGSYCVELAQQDFSHAFAALKTIEMAWNEEWMKPDKYLNRMCLEDYEIPEGDCVREDELRWKVSVHELGHAIGNLDHQEAHCVSDIEGPDASIMTYGCFYHNWFDGYFSKEDILGTVREFALRKRTPHDGHE